MMESLVVFPFYSMDKNCCAIWLFITIQRLENGSASFKTRFSAKFPEANGLMKS